MSVWYLVYTKPRQERTALRNLKQQNYTTYLPLYRYRLSCSREYSWIIEPLFPRYLFLQLDPEVDNWGPIRSTRGVVNLVYFGGLPAKIPNDLIDCLKVYENKQITGQLEVDFQSGDQVEVVEGVMANYQGIFQEKLGEKRAMVLLKFADRYMRVCVPIKTLERVKF